MTRPAGGRCTSPSFAVSQAASRALSEEKKAETMGQSGLNVLRVQLKKGKTQIGKVDRVEVGARRRFVSNNRFVAVSRKPLVSRYNYRCFS